MSDRKRTILVVLGCDLDDEHQGIGEETEMRCRRAAGVYRMLKERGEAVTVIVSPGFDPKGRPWQKETMAQMMRDFLLAWWMEVDQFDIWIGKQPDGRNVWGSRAEIEVALRHRLELSTEHKIHTNHSPLHVVTSWYHKPRVKMIARSLGAEVAVHVSDGSFSNAFQEIWKIPAEWLRLKSPRFGRMIASLRRRST